MARLQQFYKDKVISQLKDELGLSNVMEVPRITKITLNMGVGEATTDKKVLEHAVSDMTKISGQKPIINKARKSVAGFKVREGWPIGCKGDFRGLSAKSFDGRGNYSMGVKEQIIFPEVEYDKIDKLRGMDITITTTARTNDEGRALLKAFNFPLKNLG